MVGSCYLFPDSATFGKEKVMGSGFTFESSTSVCPVAQRKTARTLELNVLADSTFCDNATKARPAWRGIAGNHLHMLLANPFSSNDLAAYRKVRDYIEEHLVGCLRAVA
jgi:hypothetical protein